MQHDEELLRRFAGERSEEAFSLLVGRYCNLVWSAAFRVLNDPDLARDAAQTVFADLARKAGRISAGAGLAGWLYRAAFLEAKTMARAGARRAQREGQYLEQGQTPASGADETGANAKLLPLLDAALAELEEPDRTAVVLRFLSSRSLAEVGSALGASENAAQKRIVRALEKLRDSFHRRGVDVSGGLVAAALSAAGAQTAPPGLTANLAAGAVLGAVASPVFSIFTLMKTKLVLGLCAAAAITTVVIAQRRSVRRLESENFGLRRQLAEQRPAAPPPQNDPSSEAAELGRLRAEHLELLHLRGEYGLLLNKTDAKAQEQLAAARAEAGRLRAEAAWKESNENLRHSVGQLGALFRINAQENHGVFATNFATIKAEFGPISPKDAVVLDQLEFANPGRALNDREADLILLREINPREGPDGQWSRACLMADGSSQIFTSPDGNFAALEQPHLAAPGSSTPGPDDVVTIHAERVGPIRPASPKP